jgi:hypothetical protein
MTVEWTVLHFSQGWPWFDSQNPPSSLAETVPSINSNATIEQAPNTLLMNRQNIHCQLSCKRKSSRRYIWLLCLICVNQLFPPSTFNHFVWMTPCSEEFVPPLTVKELRRYSPSLAVEDRIFQGFRPICFICNPVDKLPSSRDHKMATIKNDVVKLALARYKSEVIAFQH